MRTIRRRIKHAPYFAHVERSLIGQSNYPPNEENATRAKYGGKFGIIMDTTRINQPNERYYTLYEPDEPRPKVHRFQRGERAWNRGMTWDDMGVAPEKRQRILANLARGRASLDHHLCGGRNARPVIQMDLDGNRLHWYKSSEHAARKLGLCGRNIRGCCEGKRNKCGGFKWEFDARFDM